MKLYFFLILLLCAYGASAYIVDPASTGFGSQNRTQNGLNMTTQWRTNNATIFGCAGSTCYTMVPWHTNADSCAMNTIDLHVCQNGTPSTGYSNESFCQVTDEFSRAMYADALYSGNNTLMDGYINSVIAMNDSGHTYTNGRNGGNLTNWVTYANFTSGTGWQIYKNQVVDTATDADAYMLLALAKVNTSTVYNSSNRARAGALVARMCYSLVNNEMMDVRTMNLTYRHRSGNMTYIPSGGSDVNGIISNNDFTYQAYNAPILDGLAACRHYYGDNDTGGGFGWNWTQVADGVFGAHLQAANWTGSGFKAAQGRIWKWQNISSGNTPYALCTTACTDGSSLLGVEYPDSFRVMNLCRSAYVWQNLTGVALTNASLYCQQYAASSVIQPSALSCNTQKYDQSGVLISGGSASGGFRDIGICMSLDFLYNTTNLASKVDQYNTHYSCTGSKCSMDSQACFGVYDKSFGLTDEAYAIGLADSLFTNVTSAGDTTPPVISSISCSPTNQSLAITWTTDESANSTVKYGTTTALSSGSNGTATIATSQARNVYGLTNNTQYYYNVTSCDASGNCATTGPNTCTTNQNPDPCAIYLYTPIRCFANSTCFYTMNSSCTVSNVVYSAALACSQVIPAETPLNDSSGSGWNISITGTPGPTYNQSETGYTFLGTDLTSARGFKTASFTTTDNIFFNESTSFTLAGEVRAIGNCFSTGVNSSGLIGRSFRYAIAFNNGSGCRINYGMRNASDPSQSQSVNIAAPTPGQIYVYVLTFNASNQNMSLYQNGVLLASFTNHILLGADVVTPNLFIGDPAAIVGGNSQRFMGTIRHAWAYNRTLTSDEITALNDTTYGPSGLVADWPFNNVTYYPGCDQTGTASSRRYVCSATACS